MVVQEIVETLRKKGWAVAVHNDYRLDGRQMTFWLFTHSSGVWAKGEGETDWQALVEVRDQAERRLRWATAPEVCKACRGTGQGPLLESMVGWRATLCNTCGGRGERARETV